MAKAIKFNTITYEKKGSIAIVTLNKPEKLNIITPETLNELIILFSEEMHYDLDICCVILASTGKAFSAGADIGHEVDAGTKGIMEFQVQGANCFKLIENFRTPVIFALNGYCLGGGAELALVGDIRIAAENLQIGWPEIKLSAIAGWSATRKLPAIVGPSMARKLLFTGEFLKAQKALELGLLDQVVPAENLLSTALELASTIASYPPLAMEMLKRAIVYGEAFDENETRVLIQTEDSKEAYAAFLEKRNNKGYRRK